METGAILRSLHKFHTELMVLMSEHKDNADEFCKHCFKWLNKHALTIDYLEHVTKKLQEDSKNVSIASLVGSSVSLVGCAGIALAPFTGGISAVVAAASLIGTSAGSLTSVGAHVVGTGLNIKNVKEISDTIDNFCQETLHLSCLVKMLEQDQSSMDRILQQNQDILKFTHKKCVTKVIRHEQVKKSLEHIKLNIASVEDYCLVINFLSSENFYQLLISKSRFNTDIGSEIYSKTRNVILSLISTVNNMKKCITILKVGEGGALKVASLTTGVIKKTLLGVSAAIDVADILSSGKKLVTKSEPEVVRNFKKIIKELELNADEVRNFLKHVQSKGNCLKI